MRSPSKLVVVVADRAYEAVLTEVFVRFHEAGFGPVDSKIVPDPFHDSSGKLTELLRPFLREYNHALVLRDFAGSGYETEGAREFEQHLEKQMHENGWSHKHYAAIVTEPEIEEWLRLPSPSMLDLLQERARKNRNAVRFFHRVLDDLIHAHVPIGGEKPASPRRFSRTWFVTTEFRLRTRCAASLQNENLSTVPVQFIQSPVENPPLMVSPELNLSTRVHGKGNVGAKPKGEVVADILAAIKERRS